MVRYVYNGRFVYNNYINCIMIKYTFLIDEHTERVVILELVSFFKMLLLL